MSCQLFTRFSDPLQWIMESKDGAIMSHIIDDFCFVGPASTNHCKASLQCFVKLAADIGIPIKHEKTTLPSETIAIYGIEVDSVAIATRLPLEKVKKIPSEIHKIERKKKVTFISLQSKIGSLNFATFSIVPGRAFLRRL